MKLFISLSTMQDCAVTDVARWCEVHRVKLTCMNRPVPLSKYNNLDKGHHYRVMQGSLHMGNLTNTGNMWHFYKLHPDVDPEDLKNLDTVPELQDFRL